MEEIKKELVTIKEGEIYLVVPGITNINDIKKNLSLNLEKYKNIIWTEETRKDVKNLMSELKPQRTIIKKIAASFKRDGEKKVRVVYDQIKEIEQILDEVINPLEESEKKYIEECRIFKLNQKKAEFKTAIDPINEEIERINLEFNFIVREKIEFDDKWANSSSEVIAQKIADIYDNDVLLIEEKFKERKNNLKDYCELLTERKKLSSNINFELILGTDMYETDMQVLKDKLNKFADNQIETERLAKEKIEKEVKEKEEKRLAEEKEKLERLEKERLEKERLEIKKEQNRIDKIEADKKEKERLEKEKEDKIKSLKIEIKEIDLECEILDTDTIEVLEYKLKEIKSELFRKEKEAEHDRLAAEKAEIERKEKEEKRKSEKTKTITLKFEDIKISQAILLLEFLNDNNINYEKL